MKNLSLVAIAIALLLIIFASPPYSHQDAASSTGHHNLYWVNPDGSRGMVTEAPDESPSQRRPDSWVNPDGARGTDLTRRDESLGKNYSWVNPDGTAGGRSSVHARAGGTDSPFETLRPQ